MRRVVYGFMVYGSGRSGESKGMPTHADRLC